METIIQQANIQKLKELVKKNNICLFCIDLKSDDGSSCSRINAKTNPPFLQTAWCFH